MISTSTAVDIRNTSTAQSVVLRGLTFSYGIVVRDAKGQVLLDSCVDQAFFDTTAFTVDVSRSDNVQMNECMFGGRNLYLLSLSGLGPNVTATDSDMSISHCQLRGTIPYPSVELVRSRCLITGGLVRGGDGQAGIQPCSMSGGTLPTPGEAGIDLVQSTLLLLDSFVTGGSGGAPGVCSLTGSSGPGAEGGPAIRTDSSTVLALGIQPVGGLSSAGGGAHQTFERIGTANQILVDPGARPPQASIRGKQQRGSTLTLQLIARPHTPAILLASTDTALIPFEPIGIGSLLSQPQITIGPLFVPPAGDLALPWQVPTTFALAELYQLQFVTLDQGVLWASNPAPLTLIR